MAIQNAARDNNRNVTIQGVDSIGFTDPTNVAVNATTHAMLVDATTTPSGTQDVNLTKVGGTTFALGQALAASSIPVVLTAAQISTLTPLATVAVTQSTSPWVVDTEFPAAAALADATANPTTTLVGAMLEGFNGTTWDRVRSGAFTASATPTGILNELPLAVYNSTLPTFTTGQYGHMQMGSRGQLLTTTFNASTGADAVANTLAYGFTVTSTTIPLGAGLLGFNGTTWDRLRSGAFTASATPTGLLNTLGLSVYNATPPTFTDGQYGHLQMSTRGSLHANIVGFNSTEVASVLADGADALGNNNNELVTGSMGYGYNGSTWDRLRSVINSTNSTGTGIQGVGLIAQFDDTSPTTVTENQFGNLRMSTNGVLYTDLRSATGVVQLPVAATAADAYANPTITQIGADLMGFNGTTWDRVRTGSVAAQLGNLVVNAGTTSGTLGDTVAAAAHYWRNGADTVAYIPSRQWTFNGTTYDRLRSIINATDSTGIGITAAGLVAQFDDTTPGTVTENQFGNLRMSVRREVYNQIRDAAGNERGVNVSAGNALLVDGSATTQPVSGTVAATQSGTWNIGTVTTVTTANLAAETTKVIGVTRTADGGGNLLTSNSTTYTAKFGLDSNLLGTLGTAFSTAGKVDVKGADGDVFVRQATGTNLHVVTDSGTITTVSTVSALGTGTTGPQKAEDTASADLDAGIAAMAVRKATPANTSGLDGDYEMLQMSAGRLWVDPSGVTLTVASHAVTNAGTFAVQAAITAASGSISSGAIASGALASGSIASGAIAAGAIAAGDASIATTEDTARAAGEHIVKVGQSRLDTPVANAGVGADGDYTNFIADNFGKTWVSGTIPEDTAHISAEAIAATGSRRIDTLATSAGSSADWATVNQSAEGGAWATLAGTATPNGLLVGNFTSGDTYTALTNTAQAIKASAGNMYGYYIYNPNSAATYVMVYNIAAASVTVGTSTAILVFCIPATSGANLMFPVPIPFSNAGWSIAAATTGGGNTAPATALEAMVWYL